MSAEIIVPEGLRPFGRESDFITRAQAKHDIIMVFGPIAQLVTELCERVQVIEDHLGIVAPDKNVVAPSNGQHQESLSGDIE